MTNGEQQITIVLSPAQIDQVVRAASPGLAAGFSSLISSVLNHAPGSEGSASNGKAAAAKPRGTSEPAAETPDKEGPAYFPTYNDPKLSRSLLRGLSVLTCFVARGEERGIIELAAQLDMSPSTTHRYVTTLVELGLLERCPKTRKYRLPVLYQPGVVEFGRPLGSSAGLWRDRHES
jgi:predicted transcriptional regulator